MSVLSVPNDLPSQKPRNRFMQPFEAFSPAIWHNLKAPPYDWIVENCFLRGTVALLSGDGGLGKSLLMQQLCTASAIGARWLDLETKPCKSLFMACEDDRDELHRRQESINRHYGCASGDLADTLYVSRAGMENILMEFRRNDDKGQQTPLFDQLAHCMREHGAEIVVIDTLSDVFAGNEIMRVHARRFVTALRRLALEMQGVVILTSHPSNTGMSTGTGISGSTAWRNSIRSMLYLTKPRRSEQDGDESEDTNERLLKTTKSNHGPHGGKIALRWEEGVFLRADRNTNGGPVGLVAILDLDRHLLDAARKLIADGVKLLADKSAGNSFSNRTRQEATCKRYSFAIVCSAQDRMLASRQLERVEMGPPSKRFVYVRPADTRYPGEVKGEAP